MEKRIKQIIGSLVLEYLSKMIFTVAIFCMAFKVYNEFGGGILKFKTSLECTLGISILSFIFFSYRFYLKIDSLIIKDLENIIEGISYDSFKNEMNTFEFKKIQKALIDKNKKIDEKDEFINSSLSYISHDMKTPLTAINTNLKLLRHSKNHDDKNIERLNRIESETKRISDYIENLMDVSSSFSKSEKRERIKLDDLLSNIKKNVEIYSDLREEEIQFESDINHDNFYVIANINKLQKSFIHLLNNAYEHKKEKIKVKIKLKNEKIIIDVEDDGMGFNDESIKKAKEIFYTDNYGRTSGKGYGVGLYFVNSYMESLGGKLNLKNKEDGGGIQSIEIPIMRGGI